MINIQEIVLQAFEKSLDQYMEDWNNISLSNLPIDSLGFINAIVEIENELSISIPDEYLIINELPDVITFSKIVENLYSLQTGNPRF